MTHDARQQRWLGMALCAAAMATIGSTVVASRLIAGGLPPFTATATATATALAVAVAAPVLWGLMRLTRSAWPRPGRRDGALLLVQAAAGSVGYTVLLIGHAPRATRRRPMPVWWPARCRRWRRCSPCWPSRCPRRWAPRAGRAPG